MEASLCLASGPFLTPEVVFALLAMLACPALALLFLTIGVVSFFKRRKVCGTLLLLLALVQFTPFLWAGKDSVSFLLACGLTWGGSLTLGGVMGFVMWRKS